MRHKTAKYHDATMGLANSVCKDGARSLLMATSGSRYDDTTGIGELLTLKVTLNVPGEDFYQ